MLICTTHVRLGGDHADINKTDTCKPYPFWCTHNSSNHKVVNCYGKCMLHNLSVYDWLAGFLCSGTPVPKQGIHNAKVQSRMLQRWVTRICSLEAKNWGQFPIKYCL